MCLFNILFFFILKNFYSEKKKIANCLINNKNVMAIVADFPTTITESPPVWQLDFLLFAEFSEREGFAFFFMCVYICVCMCMFVCMCKY